MIFAEGFFSEFRITMMGIGSNSNLTFEVLINHFVHGSQLGLGQDNQRDVFVSSVHTNHSQCRSISGTDLLNTSHLTITLHLNEQKQASHVQKSFTNISVKFHSFVLKSKSRN